MDAAVFIGATLLGLLIGAVLLAIQVPANREWQTRYDRKEKWLNEREALLAARKVRWAEVMQIDDPDERRAALVRFVDAPMPPWDPPS